MVGLLARLGYQGFLVGWLLVDSKADGWPVDEEVWSVGCLLLMIFGWLIGMVCWFVG